MSNSGSAFNNKLVIANCSGFFGDRLSAARQMVEDGPIDILTGDYLAELTMAILHGKRSKDPQAGYVDTFLVQMKHVMALCLEKGIKVVSNAGGLNPAGLADQLKKLAAGLGLNPKIAYIQGDDLMDRLGPLQEQGEPFVHMDQNILLKDTDSTPITANAYLGCWGIVKALEQGADIVVGGRIADAALVAGPAAWKFNWARDDWDQLAGAYAAGHIIECGTQATGGNYSFFKDIPSFDDIGFPFAEVYPDGSSVISKHAQTGGLVSKGTVTAQLMYEIRQPQYLTPDVTVHFESVNLSQQAPDRVFVSAVKGSPPPETAKVCINVMAGYRNTMTVILTGLDIEEKARIVKNCLFNALGGKQRCKDTSVQLIRCDKDNPANNDEAFAYLRISVLHPNPKIAGKYFSSAMVNLALSCIAGFTLTAPPDKPKPAISNWPCLIPSELIRQQVVLENETFTIASVPGDKNQPDKTQTVYLPSLPGGATQLLPLGRIFATRSGDKAGNANLGIWGDNAKAYVFLREHLTINKLKELLPDLADFEIERYAFANLYALNFYIKGILGDGAANCVRIDGQAKTLGEYLRMKLIDVPEAIVPPGI
ncbi:MAG: DUF1446 domain-containing protein [Desulfobacteraceae bacterium]|nr:DUF1446 domain-containing protein [Desulfobacteraceae bacterium]